MDSWKWFGFLLVNIFCSLTQNPLVVGFGLMLMSFMMLLVLMSFFQMWYSLIFFLIYVGAVLVLVFYMVCVNSNPNNVNYSWAYIVAAFSASLFFFFSLNQLSSISQYQNFSIGLTKVGEIYIQGFLFFILLFLLWFISKFTFLSVGSIRGFA